MSKPTVALDVDSTLAATSETAFDLLGVGDQYSYDDIESWSWGLDTFGDVAYLNAMWHAWSIRGDEIQPTEGNLHAKTRDLSRAAETLDVVTSHPEGMLGVDNAKQRWLDEQGVVYDEYRSVDGGKAYLGYDIYIDDKPKLPERTSDVQEVLLYDQPYNQDADGDYKRVWSLGDAVTYVDLWGDHVEQSSTASPTSQGEGGEHR